jgi:predicted AlkP superfamily pyrophosphatase or phosphodiesterase
LDDRNQAGQKSAAMFWPGSEAIHPTYWKPFDDSVSNADRVKQVLEWMTLPEAEQPSFSTLYFSEVDHAGHDLSTLMRPSANSCAASTILVCRRARPMLWCLITAWRPRAMIG